MVLGTLTHKSPRCLQVGNGCSDVITGCAYSLQSCSWTRQRSFVSRLLPSLGCAVPGSVCEEHIDDLSQFVTNTSRVQLMHDAALIGKAVKDGTAKLGLNLVLQIDSLGKRQVVGKPARWPLRGRRCSHLSWGSSHRLGNRNCSGEEETCGKAMEAHLERQAKVQECQPPVQDGLTEARTTHDDGHPPCSSLRPHRTMELPPHRSTRCAETGKWAR